MRCRRGDEGRKLNLKIIAFTSPSYKAEHLGLLWSTFCFPIFVNLHHRSERLLPALPKTKRIVCRSLEQAEL